MNPIDHKPPVVGIAQMRMHGRPEENTALVLNHLVQAAEHGAGIVVFPELAITGFHRHVREEADAAAVSQALRCVQAACAQRRVACAIGAPVFAEAGGSAARPLNGCWLIDEQGAVAAVVCKAGLTPSEATYFAAGSGRPRALLQGWRCSAVLCREVEDDAWRQHCPPGAIDMLFWPSILTQSPPPTETDYLPPARAMARQLGVWVVQCNWPNALNAAGSIDIGGSRVIAPDGQVMFSLPADEAGLGPVRPRRPPVHLAARCAGSGGRCFLGADGAFGHVALVVGQRHGRQAT